MDTVELVESCRGGNRFDKILTKLQDDMGLEYVNFGVLNPLEGRLVAYSTYPDEWTTHYVENGYAEVDPSAMIACHAVAPVEWKVLRDEEGYGEVFSAASDFKIPSQGLTIPVRGYLGEIGLLGVSSSMPPKDWEHLLSTRITALQQHAAFLVDRISSTITPVAEKIIPNLSRLEREVLQWIATGADISEVSGRMGLSDAMVQLAIRSARSKLRVTSTPQAVGRAIQKRLISPI